MSVYQSRNISNELKIRAGVHKRFMLIRDTATGLHITIEFFIHHLTVSNFQMLLVKKVNVQVHAIQLILTETDIRTLKVRVKEQQQQSGYQLVTYILVFSMLTKLIKSLDLL